MTRAGDSSNPDGVKFEFATAGQIVFGAGVSDTLPRWATKFGRRVLLVTGSQPTRFATLAAALEQVSEFVELYPIRGEPMVGVVGEGARRAQASKIDVVVGLGGGSAIDAGKAIAALAENPGDPLDYLEVVGRGKPLSRPPLPFLAVPTTAGTGAEVTRNAVLAVPEAGAKVSLRSASMLPKVALVDPLLTHGLSAATTATTGLDALTQLIEPFLSCRANPVTDALCRDFIPRAARALPMACREPGNAPAREDLALAALVSGIALANAGLGAVHGFAAAIGGKFAAPHGAVCAALLPHCIRINLAAIRKSGRHRATLARFDELGLLLTGVPGSGPDAAVEACEQLVSSLGVPALAAWGITASDLEEIVARAALASSMKANPIALAPDDLTAALKAAL